MSKTITFSYKGKDYTLEFDRKQVERLQNRGFDINKFDGTNISDTLIFFNAAFQKHQRGIKREITDEIFLKKLKKSDELIKELYEMYAEPIAALYDEPEDDEEAIDWDVNG